MTKPRTPISDLARIAELEAESEGRRVQLLRVGEERREAWQRAERAEAENARLKKEVQEARHIADLAGQHWEEWKQTEVELRQALERAESALTNIVVLDDG